MKGYNNFGLTEGFLKLNKILLIPASITKQSNYVEINKTFEINFE